MCKFVNPLSQKSLKKSQKLFGIRGLEEVLTHLDGGQPVFFAVPAGQDAAGNPVGSVEVGFHLTLEILKTIEAQCAVEPLIVVPVASLHLAVMSRRSGLDQLMPDPIVPAEFIQWVDSVGFSCMGELRTVVGLDDLRDVTEIAECSQDKVQRAVAALFLIGIDKPFPARLIDHSILVVLPRERVPADIAFDRNMLYIHLPLDTDGFRRVIGLWFICLSDLAVCIVPHPAKESVETDKIPAIAFCDQFAVQLIQTDSRIPSDQTQDQIDLLRGVCIRVNRVRTAGVNNDRIGL